MLSRHGRARRACRNHTSTGDVVCRLNHGALRVSAEHRRCGWFAIDELERLPMPEGYRRSIRACTARSG
jgi:hypothetical protein